MRTPEYVRGANHAAALASEYDGSSTHAYQLGDCILAKLNIRKGRVRKNRRRAFDADATWLAGFAVAIAEMHRRWPSPISREVARDAGLTITKARAAGASSFDLRELKRAGIR